MPTPLPHYSFPGEVNSMSNLLRAMSVPWWNAYNATSHLLWTHQNYPSEVGPIKFNFCQHHWHHCFNYKHTVHSNLNKHLAAKQSRFSIYDWARSPPMKGDNWLRYKGTIMYLSWPNITWHWSDHGSGRSVTWVRLWSLNTLRLRQHGRHFTDHTFKCIFLNDIYELRLKVHWSCS